MGTLMLDRMDWNCVVNPNSSAAPIAPNGLYRPKIIAASAMYPSPEDMLGPNAPTEPIVKYAPPIPAMSPEMITFRYRTASTRMPTVSAATGCSPTARVRRPHRVRKSPTWTSASTTYVMYRKTVESKKTGPMIGMSPSPGIFTALKVFGLLSVSAYCPVMSALYRYPVRPRISVLRTTPSTTWSTRYAIANSASRIPTSDPASAPHTSPSHSDPVTDVAIAAQNAPSSSWPSMAMLITPEVEQITPVSAPSMIGIEMFSVPDIRFTTLNGIVCPPDAQAISATMNRKSTAPTITRRHTRPRRTMPSTSSSRAAAKASVRAPHR